MTLDRPLRVGSRGSPLALIQDDEAISQLKARHPGLEFEVVIVRTSGDANQTAPLAGMGLGVFVSEIEERLLSGDLDMAVHSLKDLPTRLPDGLVLGAIMERRDPRDVLVNRWNCPLLELPSGARIGTSSPTTRRATAHRYAPGGRGGAHPRQRGDPPAKGRGRRSRRGSAGRRRARPAWPGGPGFRLSLPTTLRASARTGSSRRGGAGRRPADAGHPQVNRTPGHPVRGDRRAGFPGDPGRRLFAYRLAPTPAPWATSC